jgi:hypothetical protein
MLADAHRKAAEDIESTILPLQAQPRAARVVIEGAWGAAFQWLAFGCETKYQQHLNNHTRLGRCVAWVKKLPVKRDGRILYRRGELPAPFAA